MDELAYFHQMDVATLIHGAPFLVLWAGGIVAIDYWVGARRSDSPRRGTGGAGCAPRAMDCECRPKAP
jgi:hypothetical protein